MKLSFLCSAFSGFFTNRTNKKGVKKNLASSKLRFESLEDRQLLSVSPLNTDAGQDNVSSILIDTEDLSTVSADVSAVQSGGQNYAILYNGGAEMISNYDNYYYDLKNLYNVLLSNYKISAENIIILNSDGTDEGADRNDGSEDVPVYVNSDMSYAKNSNVYAATKSNLEQSFITVGNMMNEEDHLLVFISDHGGDPAENNPLVKKGEIIAGWGRGDNDISDTEFADLLFNNVSEGYVTTVFTECFSGGILDNLIDPATGISLAPQGNNIHLYGMAAANHYESSWSRSNPEYIEASMGFGDAFIHAIDPQYGGMTITTDAYDYTEKYYPYNIARKSPENPEVYNPNEGVVLDANDPYSHPWAAGESFSIFADPQDYVVIFSGGIDVEHNYDLFLKYETKLYETLINDYNLKRENIYILSSDGTNTAEDAITLDGGVTFNSDMSFANGSTIDSATKANLSTVMTELSGKMSSIDHLLVFVADHGFGVVNDAAKTGDEMVRGWGEDITAEDFAAEMFKITEGYVTIVLTECFSGGILDNIIDPSTGKSLAPEGNNAHWYGMAAANHYEQIYE